MKTENEQAHEEIRSLRTAVISHIAQQPKAAIHIGGSGKNIHIIDNTSIGRPLLSTEGHIDDLVVAGNRVFLPPDQGPLLLQRLDEMEQLLANDGDADPKGAATVLAAIRTYGPSVMNAVSTGVRLLELLGLK
jgi:hypothetical protein